MIIAIDFDGTCVTHAFPKVGEDIGAAEVLKKLVQKGHKLILYTMRSDVVGEGVESPEFPGVKGGDYQSQAEKWFKDNDIPLYASQRNPTQDKWTTSPKCYAELYIDDAALGVPLWYPGEGKRPYVDWVLAEQMLKEQGIL